MGEGDKRDGYLRLSCFYRVSALSFHKASGLPLLASLSALGFFAFPLPRTLTTKADGVFYDQHQPKARTSSISKNKAAFVSIVTALDSACHPQHFTATLAGDCRAAS